MTKTVFRASLHFSVFTLLAMAPVAGTAATYLPLSDADLARRAPLIVRAQVLSREPRLESEAGQELVCTLTTFRVLEVLKGRVSSDTLRLELPGGEMDGARTFFPGTPDFSGSSEVILFLSPSKWHDADYSLTELGLSHFDVVEDKSHRRFALRPAFPPDEDDFLALRAARPIAASSGTGRALRDAESFLSSLRDLSPDAPVPTEYVSPDGDLVSVGHRPRTLWVNIGGVENASHALFRWSWDTGRSPNGTVSAAGTQSNLSDGSSGASRVQSAVNSWHNVGASDVRYSFVASGGNVIVNLDVDNQGTAWTTPLACGTGGVVGYGGPGSSPPVPSFKGDGPFYAIPSGTVWMRHLTGSAGCYSASNFEAGVLHEMGHTLGLGHPDQDASIHSTLCPFASCTAVMRSTLTGATTPQPDDIAGIQWYYGTGDPVPSAPTANFSAPATAGINTSVQFTDASTGAPTSWFWTFGDGASSTAQNPTHLYGAAGIYTVTLTASNSIGSNVATRTVTVTACVPAPEPCRAVVSAGASGGHRARTVPARPPR